MRRFVRSGLYVRFKLLSAGLSIFLGIAVLVRTIKAVGFIGQATPAYVLGGALIAFGVVRYREYFAMMRAQP